MPRLASVVVRLTARPELDEALASLAEQTCPCVEILLGAPWQLCAIR